MVECKPSMCEALGSILSTIQKRKYSILFIAMLSSHGFGCTHHFFTYSPIDGHFGLQNLALTHKAVVKKAVFVDLSSHVCKNL